jgi:hypothetical protein
MLFETHVDVILLRQSVLRDENGLPVMQNGRPKIETRVMMFDNGEGYMLPGGPIPELPPEECDGCDPFDDNAPAEFLAMNLVEHLSGLGPQFIEDSTFHQLKWKICTNYSQKPLQGKAVVYYYAFTHEETEADRLAVEEALAEKSGPVKFFTEEDFNNPTFPWSGGSSDEEIIRELLSLFKPHTEQ